MFSMSFKLFFSPSNNRISIAVSKQKTLLSRDESCEQDIKGMINNAVSNGLNFMFRDELLLLCHLHLDVDLDIR